MPIRRKLKKLAKLRFKVAQRARVWKIAKLSSAKWIGSDPRRIQPLLTCGGGEIEFEEGVTFGVETSPRFWSSYAYLEARHPTAHIKIGHSTWFNNDISIIAENSTVTIGQNCVVGHGSLIVDSDFHAIDPRDRLAKTGHKARAVTIGNHVFIGANVTILKGTSIGNGVTIGAGAIVAGEFPDNVLVAGNPAKVIKRFD